MMIVRIKITKTAMKSISLNPFGKDEIVILHFDSAETPIEVPRYVVKLLATAAFENT